MDNLASIGAVGVVGAFSRLIDGLDPVTNLKDITFSQQSVIVDRTGKVELARFGGEKREVVAFADMCLFLFVAGYVAARRDMISSAFAPASAALCPGLSRPRIHSQRSPRRSRRVVAPGDGTVS